MDDLFGFFCARGVLVQPQAMKYLKSKAAPLDFAKGLLEKADRTQFLTLEVIKELESYKEEDVKGREREVKASPSIEKEKKVNVVLPSPKPLGKECDPEIRILKDASKSSSPDSTLEGFSNLFRDRFDKLKGVLVKQHHQLRKSMPIKRVSMSKAREVAVIGLVNQIRETSKGHKLIELEDETDSITALVPRDNMPLYSQANLTIPDEVIGIVGQKSTNGNLLIIKQIFYPDIPLQRKKSRSDFPLGISFLGDIHIGSKAFLQDRWDRFIGWLGGEIGNRKQVELAGSIKYLLLPGDLVDGVGIYPNQEAELEDCDLLRQYERMAQELEKVPDWIKIIIQPGNHDAVRPSEPQPALEGEIAELFSSSDCVFVGNPTLVSVEGVEVLSYHGQSLIDFAMNIPSFSQSDPLSIMKAMLKKRHLAPMWGGTTPLAPEKRDWLVIDEIPDVFVTGHVHLAEIGIYRGVTMINASTWQAQTSYQIGMNFMPDPAKVYTMNLREGSTTLMDFNKIF